MLKKSYTTSVYDFCVACSILCVISLPFVLVGYTHFPIIKPLLLLDFALLLIFLTVVVSPIIVYCVRFGINQGARLFISVKAIEEQLIDDKTTLQTDNSEFIRLPKIKINKVNQDYFIYIENNLALSESLQKLDLSGCMMGFRQDGDCYFDKSHKWLIFRIYDVGIDYRYNFNDYKELTALLDTLPPTKIPIDNRLLVDYYHMLIVGKIGSGKSYFMYYLILQHLQKFGTDYLYIIDPKDSDLYNIGRRLPKGHGCGSQNLMEFLQSLLVVVQNRKNEMSELLYNNPNKEYKDFGLSPILIVFDEYLAVKMLYPDAKDKKEIDKVVGQIVNLGRQIGVFLIVGMQKSPADILPSSVRSNMVLRFLLGNAERTDYITTFEQSEFKPEEMEIGSGYYQLSKNGLGIRILKTPTLNFDANREIIRLTKHNKKNEITVNQKSD